MSNYKAFLFIRNYKKVMTKYRDARTSDKPDGTGLDDFYRAMAPLRLDFLEIYKEDPTFETMSVYQLRMLLRVNIAERWVDFHRFGSKIEIFSHCPNP